MRYAANCSMLFIEEPLLQRPAAAHAAGFDAIEFGWPWPVPVPADRDVDAFRHRHQRRRGNLVGLNLFAGDLVGPDCGVLSIPKRAAAFHDNVAVVADIVPSPHQGTVPHKERLTPDNHRSRDYSDRGCPQQPGSARHHRTRAGPARASG